MLLHGCYRRAVTDCVTANPPTPHSTPQRNKGVLTSRIEDSRTVSRTEIRGAGVRKEGVRTEVRTEKAVNLGDFSTSRQGCYDLLEPSLA